MPPGKGFSNPIVFEDNFQGWRKILVARSEGCKQRTDPYLFSPDKTKLRSSVELFDYMVKHPEYWKEFDPIRINVDRSNDPAVQKFAPGTRKLIKFLELVNQGTPKEDALQLVDNICKSYTRVKKTPGPSSAKKEPGLKYRRKKLSNEPLKIKVGPKSKTQFKPQIGPKSKMALLASKDGISRDEIEKLERYFLQNTCKPTYFQMHQWASEMSVEFEYISNWFQNKWK